MVVQQGNKQLKINEEAKSMYLSLGYSVVNEEGKIVEAGNATSLADIKEENSTLKAELAKYQALDLEDIEALKAELAELKAKKK